MDPIHQPSSMPSLTNTPSTLPPEAIALAGRLFEAARKGDESSQSLLRAAITRGGIRLANLTNDKGDTLVMLAAYHGHAQLVRLLLELGADPNRLNDRGQSPLAGVVFKNERDCILELLEGNADPEIGAPNAVECCRVFKQEEYLNMFLEQIEKLKANGTRATNGNRVDHENSSASSTGVQAVNEPSTTNGSRFVNGDG